MSTSPDGAGHPPAPSLPANPGATPPAPTNPPPNPPTGGAGTFRLLELAVAFRHLSRHFREAAAYDRSEAVLIRVTNMSDPCAMGYRPDDGPEPVATSGPRRLTAGWVRYEPFACPAERARLRERDRARYPDGIPSLFWTDPPRGAGEAAAERNGRPPEPEPEPVPYTPSTVRRAGTGSTPTTRTSARSPP